MIVSHEMKSICHRFERTLAETDKTDYLEEDSQT